MPEVCLPLEIAYTVLVPSFHKCCYQNGRRFNESQEGWCGI